MAADLKSMLNMYHTTHKPVQKAVKAKGPEIHEIMEGRVVTGESGSFFLIKKEYPLSHCHGDYSLGAGFQARLAPLLSACNESGLLPDLRELLFLDTETTGLSGGTGTVAFLIGMGRFTEDSFVLRQYFMRDYNEELPMLQEVNKELALCKGLVTFNGKAFDWNLLKTRFTFNRLRPQLKNFVHLDLLYPSRTLWRRKYESCRLSSLEEKVFNIHREDDIPGALIPSLYFQYLEDRNAKVIRKIITHNEMDILTLVSLLVKLCSILDNPLEKSEDELELLGAAKIFEKCSDSKLVMDCYARCSLSDLPVVRKISSKSLVAIYKRNRDYTRAAELLEGILRESRSPDIPVMIELAKHFEHRFKDIPRAIHIVKQAMDACLESGYLRNMYLQDLKARMGRLHGKLEKIGLKHYSKDKNISVQQ